MCVGSFREDKCLELAIPKKFRLVRLALLARAALDTGLIEKMQGILAVTPLNVRLGKVK